MESRRQRQLEFEQGRSFASNLLQQLDCPVTKVGVNDDRSPAWPIGFAGSISHSKNWMWTVAGSQDQLRSAGIDTEPVVEPSTRRELAGEVASAVEWSLFRSMALTPEQCFSLVFSAKEAFYKCCYPIVATYFGFEHGLIDHVDATKIRIRAAKSHPRFDAMPLSLDVHYLVSTQDVFCATWIEARQ